MAENDTVERLRNPRQLFVLSGPSGVGKNTLADRLIEAGQAVRAITATTRAPKPGEADGRDYYFLSDDEFRRWIREGRLLERASYLGNSYGTPVASVNRAADSGLPVVLTIEVDGGLQIKQRHPEATLIFIEPPSMDELKRRLRGRKREDAQSMEKRFRRAQEEMKYAVRYDFRIVNDDLGKAAAELHKIIAGRYVPTKGNQHKEGNP